MAKITKIEAQIPIIQKRKKVAAYARVSVDTERLGNSLDAQVDYYRNYIKSNSEWEYVDVFFDRGITGTSISKREGFKEMIDLAAKGGIDLILTKSIQRFARNTVDLLETVRFLKNINVDVYFEKEHISSMSAEGEFMLTILASFAQEESRGISENVKWALRKRMEQGVHFNKNKTFGYRWVDGEFLIQPEEAEVVRRIYKEYLEGIPKRRIAKRLNADGLKTVAGNAWNYNAVSYILENPTYAGDTLMQKYHTIDPIAKKKVRNKGELPMYYSEDTHEPIIDKTTFEKTQRRLKEIYDDYMLTGVSRRVSCFSGRVRCAYCGKSFHRVRKYEIEVRWMCSSRRSGLTGCKCGTITEMELIKETSSVLRLPEFDEKVFLEQIDHISVPKKGELHYHYKDGHILCHTYELRKRPITNLKFTGTTCFTTKIKCGVCGGNFKSRNRKQRNGKMIKIWHCYKRCLGFELKDAELRDICKEVFEDFTDEKITNEVEKIEVISRDKYKFFTLDKEILWER